MMKNIVHFLRTAFPFLITIGLWRLSGPWWNPGGILAIIPIFYCTFVRPIDWFLIFSILMCVCIDYNFETVCFWLAMYCLVFAINGFQTWIDVSRLDKNAISAFMIFFGVAIMILVGANFTLGNLGRGIWMFAWGTILYLPITTLIQRVHND